ncbi:hypothetical protein [Ensifer sesbaniae]|uniref:hypothetical protein n=1 Tax=Ensifer sesbaniae TaxID=1214071 RepID=UPI00156A3B3D|nr:hypothetical protein [Ensifer sesbaniae]NRQ18974.1 hypothetical protein [Ensifer sesbaniae]
MVRSVRRGFESALLERIAAGLHVDAITKLEASLAEPDGATGFNTMKADPGRVGLESILAVAERLSFIRSLRLPADLVGVGGAPLLEQLYRPIGQETAREVRRHPEPRRLGLYAIYLVRHEREIVDAVVDLLIETVHKMATTAERRVVKTIAKDFQKVHGKERHSGADCRCDTGRGVCDVIFPVADQVVLAAVVHEYKAGGSYQSRVHAVLRSSYGSIQRKQAAGE